MDDAPTTRGSLLVRLREPRDERAWSEFLAIYSPLVLRVARRSGLQEADAADLAQEVFRAVASAIDRFDPDPLRGSFRGWLFRIARNLTINALVAQRRQERGTGDSGVARLLDEQPADDPDASALFDAEYRRRLLDWAIRMARDEFTDAAWRAFQMTGIEGRDASEAARAIGTTVGTVYYQKSRVMARLRRIIEEVEGAVE